MAGRALEIDQLRKSYGATRALDGVSLTIGQGEMFGLLGPNGAGKTTMLSIVAGLLAADSGSVRIFGGPLGRDRKHLLGMVPQELALYGELTARENLRFFGQLYGLSGRELDARVASILGTLGLSDRADDPVQTFSGGMKRRLNLGAALVHGPQLLLLDEPTTGVDPQSRHHIFEEVRRLNQAGITMIYTSHYMEEVQALCTRVGILDQGRVIACDTLPNLLQRLPSVVRLRLLRPAPELTARLANVSDVEITGSGLDLELRCQNSTRVLLELADLLNGNVAHVETEAPNLERVFLHMTGRTLRD